MLNALSYSHQQLNLIPQQQAQHQQRSATYPPPLQHPTALPIAQFCPPSAYFAPHPSDLSSPSSSAAPPNIARPTNVFKAEEPVHMHEPIRVLPPTVPKRPRGERIASKDFIPPDVSGLSKREARLVKNRAAAFLSRQRKREEFEALEIRVAELEAQNAHLIAQLNGTAPNAGNDAAQQFLVQQLQARLANSEHRARALEEELALLRSAAPTPEHIKDEPGMTDGVGYLNRSPSPAADERTVTGLSLMVMLSLATLLGPTQQKFAFSADAPPATPIQLGAPFSFDTPHQHAPAFPAPPFSISADPSGAEFDISFSRSAEAGKLRVHIHPPSAHVQSASPPAHQTVFGYDAMGFPPPQPQLPYEFGSIGAEEMEAWTSAAVQAGVLAPNVSAPAVLDAFAGSRRRVRIALRSAPHPSSAREWEVEVMC